MDKSTLPGLVIGLGALLLSILLEGGNPATLLNVPAAVLVFGGTLGAAMMSFPFGTVIGLPKYLLRAFLDRPQQPTALIETFAGLADRARREGLLALEQEAESLDPFARTGIQLVVDGRDSADVRAMLESDIGAMEQRHKRAFSLIEAMGGYAPTMGIIGTVMGLVNVLQKLEDPSELGRSIAVAFIATLYGVASANVLWLPLASKLKHKSGEEVWVRELMIDGVLSVQAGDNPRVVREKLEAQLPPKQRADAGEAPSENRMAA